MYKMKSYFPLITIYFLMFDCSIAQTLFVNAIEFKGQSENQRFKSPEFNINFNEDEFIISHHEEEKNEFVIKRSNDSIQDLVFSPNRSVTAVAMRATDSKNRQRRLVTIDARGKLREFKYEAYKMTERLGWIVELGAVSDDGAHVLAKCARMLPENESGLSYVRHEWIILEIREASILIIDSVDAINKWHSYSSVHHKVSEK